MTPRSKAVTIVDIAKAAGVSHSTVSRVLNGRPNVASETRANIKRIASELGYVANMAARGLAGGRLGLIGVVSIDLSEGYILELVQSIDRRMAAQGLELMMCTTRDREESARDYIERLSMTLVDGLIIVLPTVPANTADLLRDRGVATVLVDQPAHTNASTVYADNRLGAELAVEHLIDLGHTRIGCIVGDPATQAAQDRLAGWKSTMRKYGLETDDALMFVGDFRADTGVQAVHHFATADVPITAIVAANDVVALAAIGELQTLGKQVPADVSVIGFDDIPDAVQAAPALTTVRQPLAAMGAAAVELLVHHLDDDDAAVQHHELPTELIVRASTGPARS